MDQLAPNGPVYQAGTVSGNPLAVTAGIATLKILKRTGTYEKLENLTSQLEKGFIKIANETNIPVFINHIGSMFTLFFTPRDLNKSPDLSDQGMGLPVFNWDSAKQSDLSRFSEFFWQMLNRGIYLAPSQYESGFLSTAHTSMDIQNTIDSAEVIFKNWAH